MSNKEPKESSDKSQGEYEIESIVKSIYELDLTAETYSSSSEEHVSDDDIEELVDESELAKNWTPNVFMKPTEEEFIECYSSSLYLI